MRVLIPCTSTVTKYDLYSCTVVLVVLTFYVCRMTLVFPFHVPFRKTKVVDYCEGSYLEPGANKREVSTHMPPMGFPWLLQQWMQKRGRRVYTNTVALALPPRFYFQKVVEFRDM